MWKMTYSNDNYVDCVIDHKLHHYTPDEYEGVVPILYLKNDPEASRYKNSMEVNSEARSHQSSIPGLTWLQMPDFPWKSIKTLALTEKRGEKSITKRGRQCVPSELQSNHYLPFSGSNSPPFWSPIHPFWAQIVFSW